MKGDHSERSIKYILMAATIRLVLDAKSFSVTIASKATGIHECTANQFFLQF